MLKRKINSALVITALLFSGTAFAQDASVSSEGKMSMVVPQKAKKTVYNFDEVDILGNLKKPEGSDVVKAPEFQFKKLLNLDESFIPNILNSVDEY
jgi:hypothetical protein